MRHVHRVVPIVTFGETHLPLCDICPSRHRVSSKESGNNTLFSLKLLLNFAHLFFSFYCLFL